MKLLGVITVFVLVCSGCTVSHRSEVIDTINLAAMPQAPMTLKVMAVPENLWRGVRIWRRGGNRGFGAAWFSIETAPPSGAVDFARSIAMINYSKKIKSIKYDEFGGSWTTNSNNSLYLM